MNQQSVILIGYSGHAYVVGGIFRAAGQVVAGYCDNTAKSHNPFSLPYLGTETSAEAQAALATAAYFVAIGDNQIRQKIHLLLAGQYAAINAIHPSAIIDPMARVTAASGIMIAARVAINPLAQIGQGAICNTGCIIEHECYVGDFAHIGPGAVLCGNVRVGAGSFVGAGAVVRQGISIGRQAMIGAGAVVVKEVPDGAVVMGNPARPR
jgi:sugar O-acyltransferase (sialic acid O-acetyltransferase NeuD family)